MTARYIDLVSNGDMSLYIANCDATQDEEATGAAFEHYNVKYVLCQQRKSIQQIVEGGLRPLSHIKHGKDDDLEDCQAWLG